MEPREPKGPETRGQPPQPEAFFDDRHLPANGQARATMLISREPAKAGADPFFSGRKHFPELDGLRALAIVGVICVHFGDYVTTGQVAAAGLLGRLLTGAVAHGAWGVDLFFTLSGFLITDILLRSRGQKNYFRNFYARRTLRIFPLYYGALFGFLVLLPLPSAGFRRF